ncbi:MAG: hypothetical protein Kow0079_09610 [Vicingaceae bacterium]
MKKLLLSAFALSAISAMAQLPVNQNPSTRNAILEEFTGIHCGYCPDGHKISNDLQTNNPGQVFAINIHAGGYAVPSGNEPDFRTTDGTAIDAAASPSGYPAGGVNRGNGGGWAVGRGSWSSMVSSIIVQNSPANVAVEGSVDAQTRVLTVDVEAIYPNGAPAANGSNNYLHVALLQNNIAGPQSDYGNFNPTGWQNQAAGIYNHIHMFRMFVNSGNPNGDAISTAQGTVISKQYTVTLPADINGVALELGDLELVAYITEGNNLTTPIVSGNKGPVNVILPNGVQSADAAVAASHSLPSGLCDANFTPKVTVTNNSTTATIDTFEVSYSLNGGAPVSQMFNGQAIAPGGSYTHTFPAIVLNSGANTITYSVSTTADNSTADLSSANNNTPSETINVIPPTAFGTSHQEGYESYSYKDEVIANAIHDNPNAIEAYVITTSAIGSPPANVGGYGQSLNSWRWRFYNIQSGSSALIWEKLDFSNGTGHQMTFDHAYCQYQNENDRLQVFVSTDCGANWTSVWNKAGSQLATRAATTSQFYPAATEWTTNVIDLSAYDGNSEVMIKMEGTSNYGNNLYVDNINMDINTGINSSELSDNSLQVYPNPSNGIVNLTFNSNQTTEISFKVLNTLGQEVFSKNNQSVTEGSNYFTFDATDLPNGIYMINFTVNSKTLTKKVSVLK